MASNIATLGIKVDPKGAIAGANTAKRAIRGIGNTATKIKNQIFSLNGALGALGSGMVVKSALNYAASIETLQVRLKFLTGSTEKAAKAFEQMTKLAKSAPVSLQEIQQASPALLAVADDVEELTSLLEMTGDIAQVSGLSFEATALQIQRAFSSGIASAELFRDKSVTAMLGFEQGVSKTGAETKKIFNDMWKYNKTTMVGAMKEAAKTFDGQTSVMGDAWDELQLAFMKEGVFDEVKKTVRELTSYLKDPETIASVKELGKQTVEVGRALKSAIKEFNDLPDWVKTVGIVGAVLGGKTGKAVLTGLLIAGEEVGNLISSVEKSWNKYIQNRNEDFWGKPPTPDPVQIPDMLKPKSKLELNFDVPNKPDGWDEKIITQYTKMSDVIDKYQASTYKATTTLSKKDKETIRYKSTLQGLKDLYDSSIVPLKQQIRLTEMATDVYKEGIQAIEDAAIDKKVQALTDSMSSSITDMIMNIGQGTDSLKESVKDMARVILAEFVKIKVAQPAAQWLASSFNFSDIFSADGGGFTGQGSRSGGIDGRGGFPAILHPNETVVDHTKGQTSGGGETNVSVSFNITANDTSGFDDLLDSRRGMIVGIINQAMNDRGMTGVTA